MNGSQDFSFSSEEEGGFLKDLLPCFPLSFTFPKNSYVAEMNSIHCTMRAAELCKEKFKCCTYK